MADPKAPIDDDDSPGDDASPGRIDVDTPGDLEIEDATLEGAADDEDLGEEDGSGEQA